MNRTVPTRWLLLLPILPYLCSLVLPVDDRWMVPGFGLVIIGVLMLPFWLPNPLLWLGVLLLDRGCIKSVLFVGTIAALLAMLPLMDPERFFGEVVSSPGYAAWLGSMVLLVIAGYLAPLFPRRSSAVEQALRESARELSALRYEIRELMEAVEPRSDSAWRDWSSTRDRRAIGGRLRFQNTPCE